MTDPRDDGKGSPPDLACDHGVKFDEARSSLPPEEIRRMWPRLHGPCPRGCGFNGIAYASFLHYVSGDW
jgi:hypothetical protein